MNSRIVNPKFTKGEKCIFGHLVFTFSCILVLAIIYLIHLYVIHHGSTGVFNTRRSSPQNKAAFTFDNVPIGILFLNQNPATTICNTLLLSWQWSVGPAHCIAMRSHPDLSDLFKAWTIRYKFNSDKRIKRSIIHPHFNSDTFVNNIGIVHHDTIHSLQEHKIFNFRYNGLNTNMSDDIFIASWNYEKQNKGNDFFSSTSESFTKSFNKKMIRFIKFIEKSVSSLHLIDLKRCMAIMTPIIELRDHEFCVKLKKHRNIFLVHGAVIMNLRDKEILGFFSWGEKQPPQSLPLVILNLTYYREWLNIVSL